MLRGQIWLYRADPTVGDEIGKTRPCIIVSNDDIAALRLKVIVPITGWNEVFLKVLWMVRIEPTIENGLSKLSAVDTF
ncbi:MAG TPA: type II toxin-antitoxin system PemK/MazF family toxin [Leptolyngbyaceae cyanobacterium]